jgi:hypothetical protein
VAIHAPAYDSTLDAVYVHSSPFTTILEQAAVLPPVDFACRAADLPHAGQQTAPLLRHLFAAALQPQLHTILTWAFQSIWLHAVCVYTPLLLADFRSTTLQLSCLLIHFAFVMPQTCCMQVHRQPHCCGIFSLHRYSRSCTPSSHGPSNQRCEQQRLLPLLQL